MAPKAAARTMGTAKQRSMPRRSAANSIRSLRASSQTSQGWIMLPRCSSLTGGREGPLFDEEGGEGVTPLTLRRTGQAQEHALQPVRGVLCVGRVGTPPGVEFRDGPL